MLSVEIDDKSGIAILQPHGSLSESDFVRASEVIDPSIAEDGSLPGLICVTLADYTVFALLIFLSLNLKEQTKYE
ncbi:MAG TPA: hypothetical protein QF611_17315 [Pseudomonadales bacterium]|jgi:hypothetical protein|nr:hypothetical protein [Pseudomonadales bacterium]HJP52794.1 hypothetical protein [Pseudomonadales bacterium]